MRILLLIVWGALILPAPAFAQTKPAAGATAGAGAAIAVTLVSSFDPIPGALVPTDLKNLKVYRTQDSVFGRTIHFLRVGFFRNTAEAEAVRDRLLPRYPAAFLTTVLPEEIAAATGVKPTAPAPPPVAVPPPAKTAKAPPPELFALTLRQSGAVKPFPQVPLPPELANLRLYFQDVVQNGKRATTLNLGFFSNLAEAEKALALMRDVYPEVTIRGATAQEREQSVLRTTTYVPPKPVPAAPLPSPSPAAIAPPVVKQQAEVLMEKARSAITAGNNALALSHLDQILKLPPNKQSQEAQELVGVVHERNGETGAARREYNLYLKLYPEGEGAERVRQRLANLEAPAPAPKLAAAKKKDTNVTTAYGGFSQYYYYGNSKVDSTQIVGPPLGTPTLTTTDQSALLTSLDLTGRMRSGDWDNRVVIRDTYTANFLEDTENENRLYAAYAEVRNKPYDYGGRFGRQTGYSGGLPGRFDGVNLGYGFLPKWRINLVAGEPVDFNPIDSDRKFLGTSLDFGTFAGWNGNLFYIQQTVDGISDRRATGLELRYFSPQRSLLLLTDYDVSYNELNIAMLQASQTWNNKTTLNLLADHRRAPLLQTSNAVIGETSTSIEAQLQTLTEDQLRQMALDKTPIADLLMVGLTHNFSPSWQLGGDIKLYKIGSTPASGALPASPGTGNVFVYTIQGIGTGLLAKRDISVLSLSYLTSDSYDGASVGFNNRALFQDRWTLDASLRYYTQQDNTGADQHRLTPMLRVGYRWRQSLTFEFEYGMEKTTTENATTTNETTAQFVMLGYRWDF